MFQQFNLLGGYVKEMDKYNEPQIYVVNNNGIAKRLDKEYIVTTGNLGVVRDVAYEQYENAKYFNLEFDIASNLHEYKVLIIDLQTNNEVKECCDNEEPEGIPYLFMTSYPQKIFRPMPFVMNILKERASGECLKIIFADSDYTETYNIVELIKQNQYDYPETHSRNIYEIIAADTSNKSGKRIKSENNELAKMIYIYAKAYKVIFNLPTEWDPEIREYVDDKNYIPLLRNQDGEIVSYIGYKKDVGYEIVLPICEKKEELIYNLISQSLPEIIPDYFPESREFEWINSQEFLPKEIIECEERKKKLQIEFNAEIAKIDAEKDVINKKYQFLRDMLIESGQPLVNAVCEYLKWLGFSNVTSIDGSEDILREDIQVDDRDKLYIIEVKGIGGTSTDAECSQVAKHRRKREKENRDKDIIPIYIVNHQRYIRPSLRQHPPFSANQIDYAENDERGLLTTWQMYMQYKLIEEGIFTKEETRETFCKVGLLTLIPETMKKIGTFDEYFKKPKAGILKLIDFEVSVGEEVWARKEEKWVKTKIISMQLDGKDVKKANSGEVGVVTERELEKGYELFLKR